MYDIVTEELIIKRYFKNFQNINLFKLRSNKNVL